MGAANGSAGLNGGTMTRRRANILLVDDREENLVALEAILDSLGQRLVRAQSGESALKCLLRDSFAVILLDVQMPGLDGFETARFIKQVEKTRHIPIIFLTGVSTASNEVFRGYSAGAVDYVVKPFEPSVLRSKVAVFIDLEETTAALRESEARFRSAFDDAPIGMALVSLEGRWLQVNRSLCEIVGYSEEDLLTMSVEDVTHPDDRDGWRHVREIGAGELRSLHVEKRYVRADGHELSVMVSVSLLRDAQLRPLHYIVQVADITERKRLEAFKSAFIDNAAHELRSPLTTIAGVAAVVSENRTLMAEHGFDELVDPLVRQAERARQLIDNLLDLSRLEQEPSIGLEPVLLVDAVARAVSVSAPPAEVRLDQRVPDGLFAVADPLRLEQVLINLLTNAYRYGGSHISVEAVETEGGVVVVVQDDGDGVPARLVPRLFDSFTRGSNVGTKVGSGLGLAIVKHIVELMGGTIWYQAASPHGARFTFRLERNS
jgi:PAS domain S-box-containing protein